MQRERNRERREIERGDAEREVERKERRERREIEIGDAEREPGGGGGGRRGTSTQKRVFCEISVKLVCANLPSILPL